MTKRKTLNQIRKDREMRGEIWGDIQEDRKWEDKGNWRFPHNCWKCLKNDDIFQAKNV